MTRSLNGRAAVITGAGSGIGRAIALRLAEDTAKVAIWDINLAGAEETAQMVRDAGGEALALNVDCSDKAAIHAAAEQTRAAFGPIAILVNNAGIAPFTRLRVFIRYRFIWSVSVFCCPMFFFWHGWDVCWRAR